MYIGIIGINHKSADLGLRERVARACQRRFGSYSLEHPLSYVLLSTCNRTEIYFSAEDLAEVHSYLLTVLREELHEEFEHRLYSYFGSDCFFHLARVTAGMDSAMVGETEIQGQVKEAYEKSSLESQVLTRELHFLFQKSLKIGKEVRQRTNFRELLSLEEAIFQAGVQFFGNLKKRRVLFIGVSEINRKVFNYFRQKGVIACTVCNRTEEKGKRFALREGIEFLPWERLGEWEEFDFSIFGTKSPEFLVRQMRDFEKRRLVIDLSVPRNVDPVLGRSKQVSLLNVDELKGMLDSWKHMRALRSAQIDSQMIASAVERQMELFLQREEFRMQRPAAI